ncbi:hypothetical protein FA13DRAFT_1741318, partial [Coprinellus micaceus]
MTKTESTGERTDKRTGRANETPTQSQTEIFADMFRGGYDVNAFEKNGTRNARNRRAEGKPTQRNARKRVVAPPGQNATKIEQVLKNVKRRSPHQLERSRRTPVRTLSSLPFPARPSPRPSPNYRQGTRN